MRETEYRKFSWQTHSLNWQAQRPNVCQFELTFGCGLHCQHCYSDCYNQEQFIKRQLKTKEIQSVIDKLYQLGTLWLCFTGGDPLERKDFLEIYAYAKEKGFIITLFTNGYSMTEKIADYLAKKPPFVIELTFNGVSENTYEAISGVKGSYQQTMAGLSLILKRNLPLKVKTMVTRQNYAEIPRIKEFLQKKKLKFRPAVVIQARLNGDRTPCSLRISPEQIISLDANLVEECLKKEKVAAKDNWQRNNHLLFRCAIGSSDGINLNPYGKMFLCRCLRQPAIDFLRSDLGTIKKALKEDFRQFSLAKFKTKSKCATCRVADLCWTCPGKKLLETGNLEEPVEYFCRLVELMPWKN